MKKYLADLNRLCKSYHIPFNYFGVPGSGKNIDKIEGITVDSQTLSMFIGADLQKHMKIERNDIMILDSKYFIPSKDTFRYILADYEGQFEKYVKNKYDCDNFSIDFYDYCQDKVKKIPEIVKSGFSIGMIGFYFTKETGGRAGHAMNYIIVHEDDNYHSFLFEPQSAVMFNIGQYLKNRGYKDVDMAFLMI